jgi:hypothetical protein
MKKDVILLALISSLVMANASHAADLISVQGLEPANAEAYKLWGFIQPTYTYIQARPIAGLGGTVAGYKWPTTNA